MDPTRAERFELLFRENYPLVRAYALRRAARDAAHYDALGNTLTQVRFGTSPGAIGAPSVDPFDPGSGLRELQAEGRLRSAGRVEVDGEPAYRLVSGPVRTSEGAVERAEIVVDAETYLPADPSPVGAQGGRIDGQDRLAVTDLREPAVE